MTEHTPAPWTAVGGSIMVDYGGGFFDVAYVDGKYPNGHLTIAESKANANLISASPDLLAALVAIRECTFIDPAQPLSTPCQDCMDKVNAAIAKAKGEPCPTE